MKLITLNTWGGRAGKENLLKFFEEHRGVDIFCLQEIWAAPFDDLKGRPAGGVELPFEKMMVYGLQEISRILPEYTPYFKPHYLESYGLLMMVKSNIEVLEEGEVFVHKEKGYIPGHDVGRHARNIQYITFNTPLGVRTAINFHGLWNGEGKGDSDERLLQSQNIVAYLKTLKDPYVLAGDFNLNPETKSLGILEDHGMRNLIKEYGVFSTRTPLYDKENKFADYILVSGGIDALDFSVLPDVVSDHSPLYLEFE